MSAEENVNPHQFGEQGVLFHAPLGQPDGGTFKGNPHARLYRAVQVPGSVTTPEAAWKHVNQPGTDRGHARTLGIHWQHDLDTAKDLADHAHMNDWGGHGDDAHSVILEADHPGHEHVIDQNPHPGGGPPEGVVAGSPRNNRLTGSAKDWALIHDTVGPHSMNSAMLAEVPIRPGAPMQVHAVHLPADNSRSDEFVRGVFKAKGEA